MPPFLWFFRGWRRAKPCDHWDPQCLETAELCSAPAAAEQASPAPTVVEPLPRFVQENEEDGEDANGERY